MSRKSDVVFGLGVVAVLVGAVIAIVAPGRVLDSSAADLGVGLLGLVGAVLILWMLSSSGETSEREASGSDIGPLTRRAPERTPDHFPLASGHLADELEQACRRARFERDPAVGIDVFRGRLQETLVDALVAGGASPDRAWNQIHSGQWTEDAIAAAALSRAVEVEDSLRTRLRGWLFPGREVRWRTRRAVAAIGDVADESVPKVVGQDASRTVPVRPPTLEEQSRTADGELEPATESAIGYDWAEQTENPQEGRQ